MISETFRTVCDLEEILDYHEGEADRIRPKLNNAVMELRREVAGLLDTDEPLVPYVKHKYRIGQRMAA